MGNDGHKGDFQDPLENYDPPSYGDPLEAALEEQTAAAIQSSPISTVSPKTTVAEAVQKMYAHEIACLLVIEQGKLVGLFTIRDVLNEVAEDYGAKQDLPLSEVMTTSPVFAYEDDASGAVLSVMAASGYRHVPVLDGQQAAIGVVSPQRILNFLLAHLRSQK